MLQRMELTPEQIAAAKASGCTFLPATRNEGAVKETHGAIAMLIAGEAPRVEETAQQAVAADAEAALEMAGENAASRGGAQVVRRGGPARPRAPWRNTKRV
jgi:hypothetical protein